MTRSSIIDSDDQRRVARAAQEYLSLVDTARFRTIRKQAELRNIDRHTLGRYIRIYRRAREEGIRKPVLPALKPNHGGRNRLLSNEAELAIISFIETLERGLVPASITTIEEAVNTIRKRMDPTARPASQSWIRLFMKRFPNLYVKKTEPLEVQRKNAHDPQAIRKWFREYEGAIKKFNLQRFDIWNFDETGFRIGWLGKTKVVISRANRKKRVSSTALVCMIITN
jgi:hypothetical protein